MTLPPYVYLAYQATDGYCDHIGVFASSEDAMAECERRWKRRTSRKLGWTEIEKGGDEWYSAAGIVVKVPVG